MLGVFGLLVSPNFLYVKPNRKVVIVGLYVAYPASPSSQLNIYLSQLYKQELIYREAFFNMHKALYFIYGRAYLSLHLFAYKTR